MVKNILGLTLVLVFGFGLSACGKKKDTPDLQQQKEAQWRDRQKQQAIRYYGELIKNYPNSPHLEEAKKKLEALGPAAAPAKK